MSSKKIGGEFEIDLDLLKPGTCNLPRGNYYNSGRSALLAILRFLKSKSVEYLYLPDYICESVIEATLASGLKTKFYSLNDYLRLNRDHFLLGANSAVLLVNYFGVINLEEDIRWLKNNHSNNYVIKDSVHSIFDALESTEADFTITSFRKTLPLPDGALVKTNFSLQEPIQPNNKIVAGKFIGGLIKNYISSYQHDDSLYLDYLEIAEEHLDRDIEPYQIHPVSKILLNSIDFERVRLKRIENANFILESIRKLDIHTVLPVNTANFSPLFVPIKVPDNKVARKIFAENNIFLPIHWPVHNKFRKNMTMGCELEKCELSLIIDQRYSLEDMNRMIDILKKVLY